MSVVVKQLTYKNLHHELRVVKIGFGSGSWPYYEESHTFKQSAEISHVCRWRMNGCMYRSLIKRFMPMCRGKKVAFPLFSCNYCYHRTMKLLSKSGIPPFFLAIIVIIEQWNCVIKLSSEKVVLFPLRVQVVNERRKNPGRGNTCIWNKHQLNLIASRRDRKWHFMTIWFILLVIEIAIWL